MNDKTEDLVVIKEPDSLVVPNENTMHPMVNMAMSQGNMSPEALDKLLQVQKDWEQNEARKAYALAMANFRSLVPAIKKDGKVDFTSAKGRTNYNYETLDGVLTTIAPALSSSQLAPTFRVNQDEAKITVTCRVTHAMGHYEETSMLSVADNSGNKNNIQAVGSTVTYLQRYTLKALLGLSAGEDDDGEKSKITGDQLLSYNKLVREEFPSIAAVKLALSEEDYSTAKEAYMEIHEDIMAQLWKAPSKGGIFTTEEVKQMKSNEWSAA